MASDDLAPALVSIVDCGAAAGAAAAIQGPERPFGVLGVLAPRGRNWSDDDLNFLQTGANMLATTIERERVAAELRAKREQLQSLSRLLIEAQEVERRAVARELHDDLGQVLTAIKLNVQRKEGSEEETITLVDGAIARVRDLAQHLRPPMLDLLGLEASLRSYVKREAHRAGLEFHFAPGTLEKRAPPTVETVCFRIVQEALTNVIRHAQARRVDIELVTTQGALQLVVRDDGKGFEVTAARGRSARGETQGLLSMQERVSLVGGELEIDSAPGRGTAIRACFPLAGGVAAGDAS
jgi:signal transduction histidine kinase